MKDKATAAILAILLGWLGIHWFYLGQNGRGILYLLFSWTFIPALVAFFEFIWLLAMDKTTFDARFNAGTQTWANTYYDTTYGQSYSGYASYDPAGSPSHPHSTMGSPSTGSVADELQKFNELRRAGAITEEEYHAQKKRLLSGGSM